MGAETVRAIDVHGHYGKYTHGSYTDEPDGEKYDLHDRFMTGDEQEVVRRAEQARTERTIVSPLEALFGKDAVEIAAANRHAAAAARASKALLQWVVVHPLYSETFAQADELLKQPHCAGIKIHPETHRYPIKDYGDSLFRFAAERRALVLTHSGEPNSLPEDFVWFADRFPEAGLILAHLGMGWNGDYSLQVRAIRQSRQGNMYTDTSSARSITPRLIEWAVGEIGADRILFGTDTPLYLAAMQRTRIDAADLSEADKTAILRGNAVRLLERHAGISLDER